MKTIQAYYDNPPDVDVDLMMTAVGELLAHARTLQRRLDVVASFLLVHARDCPHKPRSDCFACLAKGLLETIAGVR
jgi:hypothetical protein